ncbi:hypothetical protein DFH27DRAFT_537623 [Peziza echinospora]|nr:hypothetical protein DFH27DRAFT_537623 [Peziza echinospora]
MATIEGDAVHGLHSGAVFRRWMGLRPRPRSPHSRCPKLQTSRGGVAAVGLGEGCHTAALPLCAHRYACTLSNCIPGTCHQVPSDATAPLVLPARHPMATISAQSCGDGRLLAGDYSWTYRAEHSTVLENSCGPSRFVNWLGLEGNIRPGSKGRHTPSLEGAIAGANESRRQPHTTPSDLLIAQWAKLTRGSRERSKQSGTVLAGHERHHPDTQTLPPQRKLPRLTCALGLNAQRYLS